MSVLGSMVCIRFGALARRGARVISSILVAGTALMWSIAVIAQTPAPYGGPITLDLATRVMNAAEAFAARNKWAVAIVIVDAGGHPVLLNRLDNASIGITSVAQAKAVSTVMFRRPTAAWGEALVAGQTGLLKVEGLIPIGGGVPIIADGRIVGAIGVSGAAPQDDNAIAVAGTEALK